MPGGGADRSAGGADQRGCELFQRLSGSDATDAVTLEQALDRGLAHFGLVGCWNQTPQVKKPIGADVIGKLKKLRVVTPEQLTNSVGKAVAFSMQVVSDARPFPQLDDDRMERRQQAKAVSIGAQRIGQRLGVAAVILGAGGREAVAEAIELLGIDSVDVEAALHQAFHDGTMWNLNGDHHLFRRRAGRFENSVGHILQTFAAMREGAFANFRAFGVRQAHVGRPRSPIDADKPVVCFHPPS